MRPRLAVLGSVTVAVLTACSPGPAAPGPAAERTTPEAPASPRESVTPPPEPDPVAEGPCPYLSADAVAEANGQRVGTVRVSDGDPPSCFFHRPDGEEQLRVRVFVGRPEVAVALVDAAAPVATSNPATRPSGWEGGYETDASGAVYAISKGETAVIVTTNQRQSVKARTVATDVVGALEGSA
ncbi:DUF2020 domain-containing protein [Saccharomonospora iraqiensis]|uniref:DUF2020 domain-containing protein n=1 Tax=Saccharomonospora iraqiensis TaxID=52698 RepID=UPI000594110F|nr:DUF2020 domain-containing protein [Saccharomonospora iraqiensis]